MMRHVVTLVASSPNLIKPEALVTNLAGVAKWRWLEEPVACDVFFEKTPSPALLESLQLACTAAGVDMISQPVEGREKKLLISDMDSTMIGQECIDELADCLGLKAPVAEITERAMNGELDFKQALAERVALLKGLPERELQTVFDQRITFTPGAKILVQTMRARGAHAVLVSGGFTFFTTRVAEALGFHAQEANQLGIQDGKLSGTVLPPILDKQSKKEALLRIAQEKNIPLGLSLAIGDGANDIPMLQTAGLGVAYRAKPTVQREVAVKLNFTDLTSLLYAQNIPRDHWVLD